MARIYAPTSIPGLAGGVNVYSGGSFVYPGDPLDPSESEFDITYWYWPTPVDIAAGATPGVRNMISILGVPVSASNADIRAAIMQMRAMNRAQQTFGSGGQAGIFVP